MGTPNTTHTNTSAGSVGTGNSNLLGLGSFPDPESFASSMPDLSKVNLTQTQKSSEDKSSPSPYPEVFHQPSPFTYIEPLPRRHSSVTSNQSNVTNLDLPGSSNFSKSNSNLQNVMPNAGNCLTVPNQVNNKGNLNECSSAPATQPASPTIHRAHPYLGSGSSVGGHGNRNRSVSPNNRSSDNQLAIPVVTTHTSHTINYKYNPNITNQNDQNVSSYNSSRRSSIGSDYPFNNIEPNLNSPMNFGSDGLYSDDSCQTGTGTGTQNSGGPMRSPRSRRASYTHNKHRANSLNSQNSTQLSHGNSSASINQEEANSRDIPPMSTMSKMPPARHTISSAHAPIVNSQLSVPEILVTPTVDSDSKDYRPDRNRFSRRSLPGPGPGLDDLGVSVASSVMNVLPTSTSNNTLNINSRHDGLLDGISQSLMTSSLHSPLSMDLEDVCFEGNDI